MLADLREDDLLSGAVTWGSYSSTGGAVTIERQMRIDEGGWIAFDGDTVAEDGSSYQVREIVTDAALNERTYQSAVVVATIIVSAPFFIGLPEIDGAPENGETLTVSFVAGGNPTPASAIRWMVNGEVVIGATSSTWNVTGTVQNDVIKAQVQLTNSEGSTAWTDSNELTVSDGATIPPSITSPIADQSFTLNQGGGTVSVPYSIAGDVLVFTLLDAPAGATVSGGNVNIPTGTAGAWDIGLRAENSLGSVIDTFQVLVDAAIYGTPVSMVQPVEGDTLADVVTWGSMATNVGTLGSPTRQQQVNGASWATYVSTTALVHPDTVSVRETWLSSEGVTRTDTTATFTVVGEPDPPVYPVLRGYQDTTISSASTSLSVGMPSGRQAGDTLIVQATVDGNTTLTATGTWEVVRNTLIATSYRRLLLRKVSDADDTLVITSSAGETLSARAMAYVGSVSLTSATPTASGTSDVGNLDLGTSAPTLWIATLTCDGSSPAPAADPPSGYTAFGPTVSSGTTSAQTVIFFATRETTAASEDVGDWQNTTNTSNRSAGLMGLRNV